MSFYKLKNYLAYLILGLFTFFCSNIPAEAQITDLRFTGGTFYRMPGQSNSLPIPGAIVKLIGNNNVMLGSAVTDSNGIFEIRIAPPLSCTPTPTYRVEASSSLWMPNDNRGTKIGCLNPGYHSFGELRMVRVLSATFVDFYSGQTSVNPNAGGGKRIYPDKQTPSDENTNRRVIYASALMTVPVAVQRIYFKVFDPDDPSSNDIAVDFNGAAANDNRGLDSQPERNTFTSTVVSGGQAGGGVEFIVTMHPGDNFIVAASADPNYLIGTVVDGSIIKDASGAEITISSDQPKAAYRTDLLTIWRRLHIEVDSMGIVTNNKVTGTITGAIQTPSGTSIFVDSTLVEYQFEPGTIVINQVGTYAVADNYANEIKTNALISPQILVGKTFSLYDDDDFNRDDPTDNGDDMDDVSETSATFSKMQSLDDAGKNVFASAYIMPVYDGGGGTSNNTNSISFVLNLDQADTPLQLSLGRNSGSNEADNFWVAYFQIAYQPEIYFDRDPDTDRDLIAVPSTLGITPASSLIDIVPSNCSNMPIGGHGTFVFQEVIRDEFNVAGIKDNGLTAPHELGHQLGINGDGAGQKIMSRELDPESVFIPVHLNLLRCRVKSPGQS